MTTTNLTTKELQTLREDIASVNDTGASTDDLVTLAQDVQSTKMTQPVSVDDFIEYLKSL